MKCKKILFVFLLLGLLFSFVGCGKGSSGYTPNPNPEEEVYEGTTRKVMYSIYYSISMNPSEIQKNLDSLKNELESLGGYVYKVNVSYDSDVNKISSARVIYKVPTEKINFTDSIDALKKINQKNVECYDVTSSYSYIDNELSVLNATKAKYQEMLDSATDPYEVNSLQNSLLSVEERISELEQKKAKVDNSTNFSTIEVYFSSNEVHKESFFKTYFSYVGNILLGLCKTILYAIPVLIFPAAVVLIILLIEKGKTKKKEEKNKIEK